MECIDWKRVRPVVEHSFIHPTVPALIPGLMPDIMDHFRHLTPGVVNNFTKAGTEFLCSAYKTIPDSYSKRARYKPLPFSLLIIDGSDLYLVGHQITLYSPLPLSPMESLLPVLS